MFGPKKSLHEKRNWNNATAMMPGLAMGTTTRVRIQPSPAPSMRAASITSPGRVMKNWRSMKMLKASPKNAGTVSGSTEFNHPRLVKIWNCVGNSTWYGSIIVASTITNTVVRPRQRIQLNA